MATTRQILDATGKPITVAVVPAAVSTAGDSQVTTLTDAAGAATITPAKDSTLTGGGALFAMADGANPANKATVAAFHNADNQSPASFAYGLLTGGVAQLLNASGNLDRARAVQGDAMPATGVQAAIDLLWNGSSYDRPVGKQGVTLMSAGGAQTAAVAAGSAGAAIKASAGRLCRILVTTTGTAALTFYDNASAASGTILGVVPANAAVGTMYDLQMPAASGIYCGGGASTPAVTVSYV